MSLTKHATNSEGNEIAVLRFGRYRDSSFLCHCGVLCLSFSASDWVDRYCSLVAY